MLENVRTLMILLSGIMVCCVRPPSTPDFSKSSKIETEKPDDNGYEEQDGSIDHHTEEAGTGGSSGDSKSEITLKGTQVSNAVTSVFNKPILSETFNLSLKSLSAIGATKGDVVTIKISVANSGAKSGRVKIRPYLTSQNYDDFQNIPLPSFDLDVKGNELKTSEFKISPFFKEDNGNREYALNRGNYDVSFQVEGDFKADWKAMSFVVAPSNAVFTAVFWSQPYFDKIGYKGNIDNWLRETFSRKSQTSNGGNLYASYEKGFDQMMGVRTMWKTFDNWRPDQSKMDSILEQVAAESQKRLGLKQPFASSSSEDMTHPGNHGYDLEIGLTENGFGGIAWIGGNSAVGGVFDNDKSVGESQMVIVHETGHNYGADHCNPLEGFIMCSGEKSEYYANGEGWYVWHDVSIAEMNKAKRMNQPAPGRSSFIAAKTSFTSPTPTVKPRVARCDH